MEYQELITTIAERSSYTPREIRHILRLFTEIAGDALAAGLDVQIRHLGKFKNVVAGRKSGRNPTTGERFPVPPSRRIKFEPAKRLRARVKASLSLFNKESLEEKYGLPKKEEHSGEIRSTDRSEQSAKRKESGRGRQGSTPKHQHTARSR